MAGCRVPQPAYAYHLISRPGPPAYDFAWPARPAYESLYMHLIWKQRMIIK